MKTLRSSGKFQLSETVVPDVEFTYDDFDLFTVSYYWMSVDSVDNDDVYIHAPINIITTFSDQIASIPLAC